MKVVFHIDENCKWKNVLGNASNVIKYCNEAKEKFEIEIVSNGEAVLTLKLKAAVNLKLISEISELSNEGVVFAACRNSLNKFAIPETDLISFVKVVPAGVVEVVKKQEEGYSYVKP